MDVADPPVRRKRSHRARTRAVRRAERHAASFGNPDVSSSSTSHRTHLPVIWRLIEFLPARDSDSLLDADPIMAEKVAVSCALDFVSFVRSGYVPGRAVVRAATGELSRPRHRRKVLRYLFRRHVKPQQLTGTNDASTLRGLLFDAVQRCSGLVWLAAVEWVDHCRWIADVLGTAKRATMAAGCCFDVVLSGRTRLRMIFGCSALTEKLGVPLAERVAEAGHAGCLKALRRLGISALPPRKRVRAMVSKGRFRALRFHTRDLKKQLKEKRENARLAQLATGVRRKPHLLRLLFRLGANFNRQRFYNTPTHIAAQDDNVEYLEMFANRQGVSLDRPAGRGKETPLHVAIALGNIRAVSFLLSRGVDCRRGAGTSGSDSLDRAALHLAAFHGNKACVEALLQSVPNPKHRHAMLQRRDANGLTAFRIAVFHGYLDCAALMATAGADVNLPDNNGYTAVFAAALSGNIATLEFLAGLGADFTLASRVGITPLSMASRMGRSEAAAFVERHISNGTDGLSI